MGLSGSKVDAFLVDDESTFWAVGTKDDAFLVEPALPPAFFLTSITPDEGRPGDTVVLAGTGFGATQGASHVHFGGSTAVCTAWSDTSITCTVPAITDDVNVWVTI